MEKMRNFDIRPVEDGMRQAVQDKIDNLNKPKGSLGRLETLAMQICLIQHTLSPTLMHPCHLLFAADHGIEREGVSVSPRDVTWQQMLNFAAGGGGVNMFCRQHGFRLHLVDVGVDHDLSGCKEIFDRKIAPGTQDFLYGPAMSAGQYAKAMDIGAEFVDKCRAGGSDIVCMGEMGIANTSPSSVWMSLLGGVPLAECVGAGAGLDDEGVNHKFEVLARAVEHFIETTPDCDDFDTIIRYFGGFEMVAAARRRVENGSIGGRLHNVGLRAGRRDEASRSHRLHGFRSCRRRERPPSAARYAWCRAPVEPRPAPRRGHRRALRVPYCREFGEDVERNE